MSEFKDDTFLARWLNGELTNEELEAFKKRSDYGDFKKISEGSALFESPNFDQEAILEKIKENRKLSIGAKKSTPTWRVYVAAASVFLVFGLAFYNVFFSNNLISYQTSLGEKMEVELPDGSQVVLNSNTTLSFSEEDWKINRKLNLKGEGYFKVEKGDRFIVETEQGKVTVLGTQFIIQELGDFFQVKCFEGSVRVESGDESEVLKPKQGVRKVRGMKLILRNHSLSEPSWITNESSFASVPLKYVLKEMSNQYDVKFEGVEAIGDKLFNGTFPHDNLDLALSIVLNTANVNYQKEGKVVVLSAP